MFYSDFKGNVLNSFKCPCLLLALLAVPLITQASPQSSPQQQNLAETTDQNTVENRRSQGYVYPQWPEQRQQLKEVVPPPPTGPYISSALPPASGINSYKTPSFSNSRRHRMAYEAMNMPMDTFSPDIPWPTNMRPPARWVPDTGYQYFEPPVMSKSPPVSQPSRSHNVTKGSRPMANVPSMNWSGMNFGNNPDGNGPRNLNNRNNTGGPAMGQRWNGPSNRMQSMNSTSMRPSPAGRSNTYVPDRAPPRHNSYQGQGSQQGYPR